MKLINNENNNNDEVPSSNGGETNSDQDIEQEPEDMSGRPRKIRR